MPSTLCQLIPLPRRQRIPLPHTPNPAQAQTQLLIYLQVSNCIVLALPSTRTLSNGAAQKQVHAFEIDSTARARVQPVFDAPEHATWTLHPFGIAARDDPARVRLSPSTPSTVGGGGGGGVREREREDARVQGTGGKRRVCFSHRDSTQTASPPAKKICPCIMAQVKSLILP